MFFLRSVSVDLDDYWGCFLIGSDVTVQCLKVESRQGLGSKFTRKEINCKVSSPSSTECWPYMPELGRGTLSGVFGIGSTFRFSSRRETGDWTVCG